MKERPILFSAPMVRAILDGVKTQTRRVVKHQPIQCTELPFILFPQSKNEAIEQTGYIWPNAKDQILALCPYGQPGDRLWVREAWARDDEDGTLMFRADVGAGGDADYWQRGIDDGASGYRWRPSIHMPRMVSRINLAITSVHVERLNGISEDDANAEGAPKHFKSNRDNFCALWQQINGDGSWDANPWVWCISFRRIDAS